MRVLNAAARVVSGTDKFDRGMSRLLHIELHWLDVPASCVQGRRHGVQLPARLSASVPCGTSRRCRITATSLIRHPTASRTAHQLSSYGRRAFCVAGPSVWNSLPDSLRNPIIGGNSFRQSLKTFLFATYCRPVARGVGAVGRPPPSPALKGHFYADYLSANYRPSVK